LARWVDAVVAAVDVPAAATLAVSATTRVAADVRTRGEGDGGCNTRASI
jgi:hypothetical protein